MKAFPALYQSQSIQSITVPPFQRRFVIMSNYTSEKTPGLEIIPTCRALGFLVCQLAAWHDVALAPGVCLYDGANGFRVAFVIWCQFLHCLAFVLLSIGILHDRTRNSTCLYASFFWGLRVYGKILPVFQTINGSDYPVPWGSLNAVGIWILNFSMIFALWLDGGHRAVRNEIRIVLLALLWMISDAENDSKRDLQREGCPYEK